MSGDNTDEMVRDDVVVLVEFDGGRAVAAQRHADGHWRDLDLPPSRAVHTLLALARDAGTAGGSGTDTWIAWRDRSLKRQLIPPERWPALCSSGLEMIHVGGCQHSHGLAPSLGFVDFDSPYLSAAPTETPFATWLVGPGAGLVHARALDAVRLEPRFPLALALLEAAKRGQRHGLRPRAEPRLMRARPTPIPALRRLPSHHVATLIRRLHGRRWLGFWLLATLLFDRRVRLPAAIQGWRSPEPPDVDVATLSALAPPPCRPPGQPSASQEASEQVGERVSALIPTLGRPDHVVQLVRDLAAQTHPPRHVVVVEQAIDQPEDTALAALQDLDVPFAIERVSVPWSGACRGRNVGLTRTDGDWILMLDDDVRLAPTVIADLLGTAHRHGVASVQARVYQPDERASSDAELAALGPPRPWSNFASGAALVARHAAARAGQFDVRHEGGFGEDYEYGVRLLRTGTETLRDDRVGILHLKAPRGGFRQVRTLPWGDEPVAPKPSPTVLYSRARHLTAPQRQGYQLFYTIKRLLGRPIVTWPWTLARVRREWRVAQRWCTTLLREHEDETARGSSEQGHSEHGP